VSTTQQEGYIMNDQINLTPEAVINAQQAVINELQGKVITLSAAVNILTTEKRALEEQIESMRAESAKKAD
jgi:outer membrane murein-binding lipoprotein Lpp